MVFKINLNSTNQHLLSIPMATAFSQAITRVNEQLTSQYHSIVATILPVAAAAAADAMT